MAIRSQRLRLLDIAEQINAIENAVAALNGKAFGMNWLVRSAVERGLEIISEATRHLDAQSKDAGPDLPWRKIADIGNWLRHAYDRVDPELIWVVVVDELPHLKSVVARLLADGAED